MEFIAFARIRRVRNEVNWDELYGSRGSDTLEAHQAVPCLWQPDGPTFQPVLQARLLSFEKVPAFLSNY